MSFRPFLAYSASAGSGKTFALSVRYIALLFMGGSISDTQHGSGEFTPTKSYCCS